MRKATILISLLWFCLSGISQNHYGFRIAYENNGIAIGGADQVFNGLKLDIVDNDYYQVRGINMSVANISYATRYDRRSIIWGANLGLLGVRGRTYGLSIFPMGNFQNDCRGISFGLINSGYIRSGISASILWTKAVDEGVFGVTTSLGVIRTKSIKGFAVAPVIFGLYQDYKYYRMELRGTALSAVMRSNYMDGFSVSLVNMNNLVHGINLGVVNLAEEMTGFQVGIFNAIDSILVSNRYLSPENTYKIARKIRPLAQLGIVNKSEQEFTTQYGIFNVANEAYCIQIGLININKANRKGLRVLPFVNWHMNEIYGIRKQLKKENKIEKEKEKELKRSIKKERKRKREIEKHLYKSKLK
ncbi:MAG: LA_2272 family surface repeat-containing protein [Salibacteraceae bacterium]